MAIRGVDIVITPLGPRGRELHDLWGSAAWFSESYPLLITDSCRHTHFYDEFWRKNYQIFTIWKTRQRLRKICRKGTLVFRILGPKSPLIWAAHTRTLDMLCYPPPPGSRLCSSSSVNELVSRVLSNLYCKSFSRMYM